MHMRACVVVGAVLALISGGALAAAEKDSNPNGTAARAAIGPASGTVPSPTPKPQVSMPAAAQVQVEQTSPAQQQAGMSKPIKVYWFLSGR